MIRIRCNVCYVERNPRVELKDKRSISLEAMQMFKNVLNHNNYYKWDVEVVHMRKKDEGWRDRRRWIAINWIHWKQQSSNFHSFATNQEGKCYAKIVGKKVEPLDVLCREDLYTFVKERRQRKVDKQTVIEDHFKKQKKAIVDEILCNMLYECGLPFNLVNKLAVEALFEAIGCYGRGYRPPSFHKLENQCWRKNMWMSSRWGKNIRYIGRNTASLSCLMDG